MIVVYGTICLDRIHRVPRLPELGGYVDIDEELDLVGGEAANTALALLKWGAAFVLGGNSLGDGELGRRLTTSGLTLDHLPQGDHFEPVCDIYVTPDGQRTMFGRGFREMAEWGDPGLVAAVPGDWFTVDANHGEAGLHAARDAKSRGHRLYLEDLHSAPQEGDFWQSSTDWVGTKGSLSACETWLAGWLSGNGGFGILSDGANGFVAGGGLAGGARCPMRSYPPFPCPRVVDSTGAGDVFRAGVLYGLVNSWAIGRCLAFASAAGSLSCTGLGANTAIPSVAEVLALIARHPEVSRHYEPHDC